MSIITSSNIVKTFDVSLYAMKQLIAKDLNIPVEELTVCYVIGDIGPSDPMDRFPATRGVIGVKVTHNLTK